MLIVSHSFRSIDLLIDQRQIRYAKLVMDFLYLIYFILILPGTSSYTPGDPFPEEIAEKTGRSMNIDEMFLIENTSSPTQDSPTTMPLDTTDLIQIAQWKYTDPTTNQTRYWYHYIDSVMGSGWIKDGVIFQGYAEQKPNTYPVHLFHSETKGIWTNTMQLESTTPMIGHPHQWKYDGILFYTFNSSMNSTLVKPVWRYWNRIKHGTEDVRPPRRAFLYMGDFFAYDLVEWIFDRALFYVFPPSISLSLK